MLSEKEKELVFGLIGGVAISVFMVPYICAMRKAGWEPVTILAGLMPIILVTAIAGGIAYNLYTQRNRWK